MKPINESNRKKSPISFLKMHIMRLLNSGAIKGYSDAVVILGKVHNTDIQNYLRIEKHQDENTGVSYSEFTIPLNYNISDNIYITVRFYDSGYKLSSNNRAYIFYVSEGDDGEKYTNKILDLNYCLYEYGHPLNQEENIFELRLYNEYQDLIDILQLIDEFSLANKLDCQTEDEKENNEIVPYDEKVLDLWLDTKEKIFAAISNGDVHIKHNRKNVMEDHYIPALNKNVCLVHLNDGNLYCLDFEKICMYDAEWDFVDSQNIIFANAYSINANDESSGHIEITIATMDLYLNGQTETMEIDDDSVEYYPFVFVIADEDEDFE